MFKTIKDAIELDPRLIDDPKIISQEFRKKIKMIAEELSEKSDYAVAYRNLSDASFLIVEALDRHVSLYAETEQ